MADDNDLFLKKVGLLERGGVLNDIVLIGSWVLPIYRTYFNNAPEIPLLRTTDVDFLVGMPPRIRREFDVPAALSGLGFEPEWSSQGGYCKYVHPEMEVEFLIPEQGRGAGRSISVDALRVEAQPLRFLSLAYDRSMFVRYQGYDIRVPEPEAFVFLEGARHSKTQRPHVRSKRRHRPLDLSVSTCSTILSAEQDFDICSLICPKGGRQKSGTRRWNTFPNSLDLMS